jgi:hypothetical protein
MTEIKTKCQFCGAELSLEVDDSYAQIGDPYKLLGRASCNRCARLRERRRSITEGLSQLCHQLAHCPLSDRAEVVTSLSPALRSMLMAYVGLMEDWKNGEAGEWDESILQAVISSPNKCGDVLKTIQGLVKPKRQRPLL